MHAREAIFHEVNWWAEVHAWLADLLRSPQLTEQAKEDLMRQIQNAAHHGQKCETVAMDVDTWREFLEF